MVVAAPVCLASISDLTDGGIRVRSVVLCDEEANDEVTKGTSSDADERLPGIDGDRGGNSDQDETITGKQPKGKEEDSE